jgi:hypothetical protein
LRKVTGDKIAGGTFFLKVAGETVDKITMISPVSSAVSSAIPQSQPHPKPAPAATPQDSVSVSAKALAASGSGDVDHDGDSH